MGSETAQVVGERFQISDKVQQATCAARGLDDKLGVSKNVPVALQKTQAAVKPVDEQLGISTTSQAAVATAAQKVHELNVKYQVTDKVNEGFTTTTTTLQGLVSKAIFGSGVQRDLTRDNGSLQGFR